MGEVPLYLVTTVDAAAAFTSTDRASRLTSGPKQLNFKTPTTIPATDE